MVTVLIFNIFIVFFAYISKYKKFRHGLILSFSLIFIFLSLRYDYGNDYMGYYKDFIDVNKYLSINYFDINFHYEPGWLFLCRLFKPFGFFIMVALLALFNCIVFYRFIVRYIPRNYYWLAVFLYVFDSNFMLIGASAMRQTLAVGIFLTAIPYIYKRDPIRYFTLIIFAYLFHSSALILLPLYFLGHVNWQTSKLTTSIFFLSFLSLFFLGTFFMPLISELVTSNFERYQDYSGQTNIGSGLGILYSTILFIIIIYFERFQKGEMKIIFRVAIIGFMFIPLSILVLMITRLTMYFAPATLVVYPALLNDLKKPIFKIAFVSVLIIFTLYTFFGFFNSSLWGPHFNNYKTIFSAPSY